MPFKIRPKNYPLPIRTKVYVGLQFIIVVSHIDQFGRDEFVSAWLKQINPLSIRSLGHLAGVSSITGKYFLIGRQDKMDTPFIPGDGILLFLSQGNISRGDSKLFPLRLLQVKPNCFSIG